MQCQNIADSPEPVREHLPIQAHDIYRVAFNNAWEPYYHDEKPAHQIAWAAVKHVYEKD